ncbi:hypothetical protein LJC20_03500 [Eubacteriales bacterium OttesenSCG-928-M02]|nr:hypothetical protein [Eubacteriales bacterium OttesenSCG-928-M02]
MSYIGEKVAYLTGLAEGLGISEETPEQKLLVKIIEVLDEMADVMDELDEALVDVDERVDDMDEDLSLVEDILFDELEDDYEDDDFLEIVCPGCGETIYFDQEAIIDEELTCPLCEAEIFPLEETEAE